MQNTSIKSSTQRMIGPKKVKHNKKLSWFCRLGLPFLVSILFVLPARSQDTPPSSYVGINLEWVNEWDVMHPFADAMKQAREAGTLANPADRAAAKDAMGWPAEDASIVVWDGVDNMNGVYKLSFTGQATVTSPAGVSNVNYNATSNTTTADITVTSTAVNFMSLTFRNTKRTPSSATNTGVTNIKLIRPGYTTQTFTNPFLELTNKFAVIRFMDWTNTNGNETSNWSERTLPTHATQNRRNMVSKKDKGVAWEYVIELANLLDKDIWINIPHRVNDTYTTQLANLLKNNLEADRKIYVEYSNELWNTEMAFTQNKWNDTAAVHDVKAGGDLNYDGSTNVWHWGYRRTARRIREISNVFRTVFGDAQMMTRIRPILGTQIDREEVVRQGMLYLETTSPRPINYYLFGAGGTTYFNIPRDSRTRTDLTVDEIINQLLPRAFEEEFKPFMATQVNWARAYNLKYVTYEGGTHMDPNGYSDAAKIAANKSEGMKQRVKDMYRIFYEYGGYLNCYFQNAFRGTFGMTDSYLNLNTPRIQAVNEIKVTAKPAITAGYAVPSTIKAGHFTMQKGSDNNTENPVTLTTGKWYNYLIRVATAGSYTIHVTAGSLNALGRCQILVNNESLGTVNIPNTGSRSVFAPTSQVTINLTPGLHSIRIKNTADAYAVQNIVVEQGTVTPPPGNGLEAENATLSGVTVGTAYTGFTGTGYADYTGTSGGYIQWTYTAASAGNYNLNFRYALLSGDRPLELRVNGVVVASSMSFPATGSWTTWATATRAVALNAGANTIRLTAIGSSGGNFDNLSVTPVQVVSQTLEAEDATIFGSAIGTTNAGYTGTGYVDYANSSGAYINWTYNATSAGSYKLDFRYALASGDRPLELRVNGVVVTASVSFPATGAWTTWGVVSQTVNLNAGANTIRLTTTGVSGGNYDHLVVTRTGARMTLTGENTTEAQALTIFANPVTNGSFEIKSAYNLEGATYTLTDAAGRTVVAPVVKSSQGKGATLAVSPALNGVYLLQVATQDGQVQTGRVIFQSK